MLAEYVVSAQLHLRPSNFLVPTNTSELVSEDDEVAARLVTVPAAARQQVVEICSGHGNGNMQWSWEWQ